MPIAKHCHQNKRNNACLRGTGLIHLHGQQCFGDVALIARHYNRSQVHFILHKSDATQRKKKNHQNLQALRLLHHYYGKSSSDGGGTLKMTAELALGFQRFVLVSAR